MSMWAVYYASIYYLFGLAWLLSGLVTGWLKPFGDPVACALYIVGMAAAWPYLVYKIVRDLARGIEWTELP